MVASRCPPTLSLPQIRQQYRHVGGGDATDAASLSNTLLAGERPANKHYVYGGWMNPFATNVSLGIEEGFQVDPDKLLAGGHPDCTEYLHFRNDRWDNPCAEGHFWSYHSGGVNFLFCDGSAKFISYRGRAVMVPLATRAGTDTFVE